MIDANKYHERMKQFRKQHQGCPAWILEAVHQKRIEATSQNKPMPEYSPAKENGSQQPLLT